MEKSKLYTRTGDTGQTSLVGGQRVPKESIRLEAYGTIDELSSAIGVVRSCAGCDKEASGRLFIIQNTLFNIGSYLATEMTPEIMSQPWCPKPPTEEEIQQIEGWIDDTDARTPKVNCFVIPGGTPQASFAHMARTICRRAERRIIALSRESEVAFSVIEYVNRLSDYLFILARYFNHLAGVEDIPWKQD